MSLVVAMVAAALFAVPGFPVGYYAFWLSWTSWKGCLGIALYLAVAGAGAGFIGWEASQLSHAHPSSNAYVNGLLYGVAGTAVLRADFSTRVSGKPLRTTKGGSDPQLTNVASLLGISIRWGQSLLDHIAARATRVWYGARTLTELAGDGERVAAEIANADDVTDAVKKKLLEALVLQMEALNVAQTQVRARFDLIESFVSHSRSQRLSKPVLDASPPT